MVYQFPAVVFEEQDGSISIVFPDLPSGITTFEKGEDIDACLTDTLFELVTEFLSPEEIHVPSKAEEIDVTKVEETFYHFGYKPKSAKVYMASVDPIAYRNEIGE